MPLYALEGMGAMSLVSQIKAQLRQQLSAKLEAQGITDEGVRVPVAQAMAGMGAVASAGVPESFARRFALKQKMKSEKAASISKSAAKQQAKAPTIQAAQAASVIAQAAAAEAVAPTVTKSEVLEDMDSALQTAAETIAKEINVISATGRPTRRTRGPMLPEDDSGDDDVSIFDANGFDSDSGADAFGALDVDHGGDAFGLIDSDRGADAFGDYPPGEWDADGFIVNEESAWDFGENITADSVPNAENVAKVADRAVEAAIDVLDGGGSAQDVDEAIRATGATPPASGTPKKAGEAAYVETVNALAKAGLIETVAVPAGGSLAPKVPVPSAVLLSPKEASLSLRSSTGAKAAVAARFRSRFSLFGLGSLGQDEPRPITLDTPVTDVGPAPTILDIGTPASRSAIKTVAMVAVPVVAAIWFLKKRR
jgi:hypothetical protein